MTKAKGRKPGDSDAGKEKGRSSTRRRSKEVSQTERPFDPAERAESHRRGARVKAERQRGGSSRGRAASSRATQRQLPFEGIQASLMAHLRPELFTQRLVRIGAGLLLLLLAAALLMIVYNLSHGLRLFALREVVVIRQPTPVSAGKDVVEAGGSKADRASRQLVSDQEIEELVKKLAPEGVLRVDLERVRTELRQHEYVRDVEVRRLLPDTLSLRLTERVPVALARLSDGVLKCIDEDGTLFGGQQLPGVSREAPLIGGVEEAGEKAADTNLAYLAVYQTFLADLDRIEPPLSPLIDEVFFNDPKGVRVILANSQTSVFLGREDYRKRLNLALDLLDAVRNRNLDAIRLFRIDDIDRLIGATRISYINATNANRITFGLAE